ncbi:MAG TPA: glycosyltransferase, partial [Gemmatimonadaceae bacterium]|nr:glycosyltransferase [Gemmatimonadaceae bacterium]
LGVPEARLRVAVEAPAEAFHPAPDADIRIAAREAGVPDGAPWFTYVGGFNPHKRLDLVIRAHAALAATCKPTPHLLLVGTTSGDVFFGELEQLRALVAECGTTALVHWTGFVPDERLRALHAGAVATLLPSECEGFGLPAVEGAACGTAVVATTESPLPDLLAGGGIFVAPGDLPALTDAMRRLLTDQDFQRQCATQALARARALTWERGARATLDALLEAAA